MEQSVLGAQIARFCAPIRHGNNQYSEPDTGDSGRTDTEVTLAEEMMVTEGDAFALQDRIATKRARQAQSGLHSAMLQIYGLTGGEDALAASVLTAYPWPDDTNPMLFALQQALNTTRTEWANFQTEVAAELPKKQNMYLALGDRARRRTTQRGPV